MKLNDIFQKKYLAQSDVPYPVAATIQSVRVEDIGGDKKEHKPVIQIGALKPMILNKHNGKVIAATYGDDTDQWLGKPVEVYADPSVEYAGRTVGGLRLRIPAGQNGHAQPKPSQMNLAMAEAALAPLNLTKADLIRCIQNKHPDAKRFEPARDTAIVYAMIKEAEDNMKSGSSFDEFGGQQGEDF